MSYFKIHVEDLVAAHWENKKSLQYLQNCNISARPTWFKEIYGAGCLVFWVVCSIKKKQYHCLIIVAFVTAGPQFHSCTVCTCAGRRRDDGYTPLCYCSMQLSDSILTAIRHVNLHARTLKLITLKYNDA